MCADHRSDRTRIEGRRSSECDVVNRVRKARSLLVALFVVVTASFASQPAMAGLEPGATDSAKMIATDAVVCAEIQHPQRLIERLSDPRFQDYLKLFPQYQKLLKDPKFGELSGVVKLIAGQLGTTWDKGLGELTGGGILAAFEADPGQGPRVYLLITPTNKELLDRASQVLLKLARQDAKDKGKPEPVKTSDHRGVAVHALGGENGAAYGIVTGKLAISNSVKNLERMIDRVVERLRSPANRRLPQRRRSHHSPGGRNGIH